MSEALEIALSPERLDEGTPEEKACFGLLRVRTGDIELVSGFDHYTGGYRAGPLVSGYHLGEWLAWNWWRLMWEPKTSSPDWWRAHNMTAIGEGYSWPNLTISSDGVRTVLLPRGSVRADAKPFRYMGAPPVIVPRKAFESAVDDFLGKLVARLEETGIGASNFRTLWSDVLAERADPETSKRRKLEALLGRDPDAEDGRDLEKLILDAEQLGEGAAEELAAEAGQSNRMYTIEDIAGLANRFGQELNPQDAVHTGSLTDLKSGGETPAWLLGSRAAQRLREREKLGDRKVASKALFQMAGIGARGAERAARGNASFSFSLDRGDGSGQIVIRRRGKEGSRFDVARLLGDRLVVCGADRLRAATHAYTYRQQMQRAFAAEFLCPFEAVEDILRGDYSAEAQEEAARHFEVSPLVVRTQLVNRKRLDRDELDAEVASAAWR